MSSPMNPQVRRFVLAILIFHARQSGRLHFFLGAFANWENRGCFRSDPLDGSPLGQESPLKGFLSGVSARQKAARLF